MRPLPKRGFTSRFQDSRIPDLTSRVGQSGPSPTSPHHAGCHHHRRARTGRSAASAHRNTAPIPPAPHPPHDGRDPCRDAAWLLMVTVSRWADVGWARADHHQRVRTTPDATTTAEPEPAVPQRRPTGTRPPSHRRRIPPRPPRFVPRCGLVADGDRLPVGRRCRGTVHASCRTVTVSTVPTADKIVRFGPPYVGPPEHGPRPTDAASPHDGRDSCRDAAWLLMVTVSRWADAAAERCMLLAGP